MCLLHAMYSRFPNSGFRVLHVDHGLRPEQERRYDRYLIQNFCIPRGIPFIHHIVSAKELNDGLSNIEALAREARYAVFSRASARVGIKTVLLAHHADDRMETQLMRFLQGWSAGEEIPRTSKRSYSYGGNNGTLVFERPWIDLTRREIEQYGVRHNIAFHEDSTNRNPGYLRNRIRNELLPLVRDMFPGIDSAFETLRRKEARNRLMLENIIAKIQPRPNGDGLYFDFAELSGLPGLVVIELLRRAAYQLKPSSNMQSRLSFRDAEDVFRNMFDERVGDSGIVKDGILFKRENKYLYIRPCIVGKGKKGYLIFLTEEGKYRIPDVGGVLLLRKAVASTSPDKTAQILSIPSLPVVIRSVRNRESLPAHATGHGYNNLKKYLVAHGLPSRTIEEVPLVEISGEAAYALTARWTGENLSLSGGGLYRSDFPFELIINEMEFPT